MSSAIHIINGWMFDFELMWMTVHDAKTRHLQHRNKLTFVDGQVKRISWTPFNEYAFDIFDPPEDHFNIEVTKRYVDWLFECQVLKDNKPELPDWW